ncbi:MAG TPA: methylenetetrahydrofolate reductase C-terminal domain-containing protein [Anaerolineales bacterium]|nr:methylenetetrahydrofolate reductase C-terminal domain-containing protein [Anaerolineales bacterium]
MSLLKRLRDYPQILEVAYQLTERIVEGLDPLLKHIGCKRADRLFRLPEKIGKGAVFNCKMCGQCTLHFTGMTCPMTCPKNLRNGPCGGVRVDKTCEVDPSMKCVWVDAFERSQKMNVYGDGIFEIQPPRNFLLAKRSAFINLLLLKDAEMPEEWKSHTGLSHDRK